MNIIILAAGPPKHNRDRHLELFNNKPLIDSLIEECSIENTNLFIVIHKNNSKLINHVLNYNKNINILKVEDEYVKSTLITALSVYGDSICLCGDLINIKKSDILKFINTKYSSCLCRYKIPWGNNIVNNNLIRRSDIGDCIIRISEKDKTTYLSDELWSKAKQYFKLFYPTKEIEFKTWNTMITHLNYAYFYEIWGNPNVNDFGDKGSIYFEKIIYADND
tara:strand:+ start:1667 stop:2329 length:663 start_codon:yes stop_codon:yes gene_type:complete